MFINWWVDKQNVHPHNGIPFVNKREQASATHHNIDESEKYYDKPHAWHCILYDCTYMKCPEKVNV